jgi:hypothetical protein
MLAGQLLINDQVQGGAPSYRHNLLMLRQFGFQPSPVSMRIAFGTGEQQWTNHSPSDVTKRLQPEIRRFGKLLKWISRLEPLFIFIPIVKVGAVGVPAPPPLHTPTAPVMRCVFKRLVNVDPCHQYSLSLKGNCDLQQL